MMGIVSQETILFNDSIGANIKYGLQSVTDDQLHAAAKNGWLDLESAMLESVIAFKRAGADLIASYFAKDIARLLKKN